MSLPSFLQPHGPPIDDYPYHNAKFHHESLGGDAHAHWWPAKSRLDSDPERILFFIPGNPGLIDFYIPFFSEIQTTLASQSNTTLAIFAHAHLGHTPGLPYSRCDLDTQVESAVEAYDALSAEFPRARVTVVAHSMGAWVTLKVMQRRPRPTGPDSCILMTPTIRHIVDTPNGKMLWWLFHPLPRTLTTTLARLTRLLPLPSLLRLLYPTWPKLQLGVLQRFVRSPPSIHACFVTSRDEMRQITELGEGDGEGDGGAGAGLDAFMRVPVDGASSGSGPGSGSSEDGVTGTGTGTGRAAEVRMYFGGDGLDGWVGKQREALVARYEGPAGNVYLADKEEVPHAFCINHSEVAAKQCVVWLAELSETK